MMNRISLVTKGLLLAALVALCACQGSSAPTPPAVSDCSPKAAGSYGLVQTQKPGFEEDIKPLLTSTVTGKVYKCTTCHQPYSNISIVGVQREVDAIVAALESGYMPLNGDKVPAAGIQLFRDWAAAGFPQTRPATTPETPTGPTAEPVPDDLGRFGEGGDPWDDSQDNSDELTTKGPC